MFKFNCDSCPETCENISRRQLLKGAGKVLAVGAAAAAAGSLTMLPRAKASVKYPWPYKKIDPARAGAIAYENWYKDFCCYATASGILVPLQESVGEPYSLLPVEAFRFGHGGTVGWGTLCGTLLGASIAASFAAGDVGEKISNDVIYWYSTSDLPAYKPANPRISITNTNVSGSPLCHVSVSTWMEKEGVDFPSPQRKDRCARLAADVAMKTAELLNAHADGTYKPAHGSQVKEHGRPAQNNCDGCHG